MQMLNVAALRRDLVTRSSVVPCAVVRVGVYFCCCNIHFETCCVLVSAVSMSFLYSRMAPTMTAWDIMPDTRTKHCVPGFNACAQIGVIEVRPDRGI